MKRIKILLFLTIGLNVMAENLTSVAMIFRENDVEFDLEALKNSIEKECKIKINKDLIDEKGNIVFEKNDDMFVIGRMPVPIPKDELKNAATRSLLFKDKIGIETKQKAHVILSVRTKNGNLIDNRLKLTMLVRSVLEVSEALGVYWGSSSQIIQKDIFVAFTDNTNSESLPIPIWLNFTVGKGKKGEMNFYSTGLKDLGYPEYEVIDLKMPWQDAYYFLLDFTNNMITTNDKISDGDTIGRDENEKLKVTYKKSELTDDNKVMRIQM